MTSRFMQLLLALTMTAALALTTRPAALAEAAPEMGGRLPAAVVAYQPAPPASVQQFQATDDAEGLSNDNYYTNVDGNEVHSPAYSTNGQVPVGATARCRDGTYSFSEHRRGTCSGHGGVSEWLRSVP